MAKARNNKRVVGALSTLCLLCVFLLFLLGWVLFTKFEYQPNYGNLHQAGKDPCQEEVCSHVGIDGYICYVADQTIVAWMLRRDFAIRPFQRAVYSAEYFREAEEEAHPSVVRILHSGDTSLPIEALKVELEHFRDNGLIRGRPLIFAKVDFFPDHIIAIREALLDHYRYDFYFQMGAKYPSDLERADIDRVAIDESLAALSGGNNIRGAARIWDALGFRSAMARLELIEMRKRRDYAGVPRGREIEDCEGDACRRYKREEAIYKKNEEGYNKLLARTVLLYLMASREIAHRAFPKRPRMEDEYVFPELVVKHADISPRKLFNPQFSRRLVDSLLKDFEHYADVAWELTSTDFWADVREFPYLVNRMRRVPIRVSFYEHWLAQQNSFRPDDAYEIIYRQACLRYIAAIEDVQTASNRDTLVALNIVHNELLFHAASALDTLCHRLGVKRLKL